MEVYISGKIRGLEADEVKKLFGDAEKTLKKMGCEVVNPLTLMDDLPAAVRDDERSLLLYLLTELSHCDAIWMIENWRQDSHGAACEYHFARSLGMKVMNVDDDILTQLLSKRYRAYGSTEEWMAKTSAELAMELDEMVTCSPSDVAAWLRAHGFKTKVVDGTYMWVVYEMA